MKKHILKSKIETKKYVFGLASPESEFQLSLLLNNLLRIKLSLSPPAAKDATKNAPAFPCFKYNDEDENQVVLLKNKNQGNFLLPGYKIFDYLVIISGGESANTQKNLMVKLKEQPNISIITEIDHLKIKGFKKLVNFQ